MAAAPDGFDIFMSVPYAADNDTTTTGSKAANHLNLKNLRRKQRSTKRAELPIAPAFAAGLPIAPATIPLSALALPIATYCSGDPNTIRREGTA